MKITNIFTSTINKILYNTSHAKLERKVDVFLAIMNRNKLIDYGNDSIDDVVAHSKKLKIKHDIYIWVLIIIAL
mgnify:CR=1 FL=1